MRHLSVRQGLKVFTLATLLGGGLLAHSQAVPTATAPLQFSAFGGISGVYTGVGLGRNLAVVGGLDATIRPFRGVFPSLEVRGQYPVDRGSVDEQRNILGGIVLGKHIGRIQPYGDFLVGQGQIDYKPPYLNPAGTILYSQTVSPVYSPGGGVNLLLTDRLAFKGDFQFQHYAAPVTTSGAVYSKPFTLGVVYRLPFFGGGPR